MPTVHFDMQYYHINNILKNNKRQMIGLYSPRSKRVRWRNRFTVRSVNENPIFVQLGE